MKRISLSLDLDTVNAVEDALEYYLTSARNNYGSGWENAMEGEHEDYLLVERFRNRLTVRRERSESP